MPTVSAQWDIKSLIERYANIEIKGRPATVHGVLEYHSGCPWCGGEDRFITRPETGQYSCAIRASGCGRTGDCIDFLREYCNMSHAEACEVLGLEINQDYEPSKPSKSVQNGKENPPPARWQSTGLLLVERAVHALWNTSEGRIMLDYLHGRGLGDEIIKKKKLGYVPLQSNGRFYEDSLENWGLDPTTCAKDKVRVPNGILIPWFEGNTLWRLMVKHPEQPKERKYLQVVGSGEGLYNVDSIQYDFPVMIVEAEFCAMAVEQEAGDLVSCVATGSSTRARLSRWIAELHLASYVLQSFDEDEGGDRGAEYWMQTLQKCMRWSPYIAKDPNDILKGKYFEGYQGYSIREWVESGIRSADVEFGLAKPAIFHKTEGGWEYVQKPTPPCKVANMLEVPQIIAVEPIEPPLTTADQIFDLAERIGDGIFVLDLETTGLNPRKDKIITLALGTADHVSIIDTRAFYASTDEGKAQWKEALHHLFHREGVVWAGHNLKFDWSFLAVHFGVKMSKVYDTMLVEKLIHNGERASASLLNTAARYDIKVTKEERNWFVGLDQCPEWYFPLPSAQITYIEQDIRVPYQIIEKQQKEIERQKLAQVIALENAALPAIAALEVQGISVDVDRWQKIIEVKQDRKERLEEELKTVLGEALLNQQEAEEQGGMLFYIRPKRPDVNLASSDQLISALAALGVVVFGASREVLEEVKDAHAVIPLLLEWKELEKFLTAFGESLMKYVEDGRIHATFDQLGAVSGRIICRSPNLQQIPKSMNEDENLRSCFVAPAGHKLLVADLSNIELRILAEASGDPTMLRFFAEGKDLHSETARLMFNLPPDIDPKKHIVNGVKARDAAKAINFGLAYGMGPSGLAGRIGVDLETAKKLMKAYFDTYKGVDKYLKQSGRNGTLQGYAVSLSGRRRTFPDLQDSKKRGEAERAAKNHPIQGTNADILKRALALLFERLPEDISVVLTVHDEIVLEAPITSLDIAEKLLKESMMEACRTFLKTVAIPDPDVLLADYWVKG